MMWLMQRLDDFLLWVHRWRILYYGLLVFSAGFGTLFLAGVYLFVTDAAKRAEALANPIIWLVLLGGGIGSAYLFWVANRRD